MDPFNTSAASGSLHPGRRRNGENYASDEVAERTKMDPQPQACALKGSQSSAGLRRSAGLFNLKLDVENVYISENQDAKETLLPNRPTLGKSLNNNNSTDTLTNASANSRTKSGTMMTPDQSHSTAPFFPPASGTRRLANNNIPKGIGNNSGNPISLKRPHPFNSAKPAKHSGFLSRSSTSYNDVSSPAGQKRLHLTNASSDRLGNLSFNNSANLSSGSSAGDASRVDNNGMADMTPDLSFRGAKPVQTAFVSTGLQSKKHVPQSPKPRVPETPCKRPINDSILEKDHSGHFSHLGSTSVLDRSSHGSPFPGLSALRPSAAGNSLSERLAAVPSRSSSPVYNDCGVGNQSSNSNVLSSSVESPLVNHPVDRLQRFSIGNINSSTEDLDPPETPTRFGSGSAMVRTSTPLFRSSVGAGRQTSETAGTATPGTAIKPRPLPTMLRSADPAGSMSASPPDSLDFNTSITVSSSSSPSDASMRTHLSPRTPDEMGYQRRKKENGAMGSTTSGPLSAHSQLTSSSNVLQDNSASEGLVAPNSGESQASPRPRRRLRLFDLWHSEPGTTSPRRRNQKSQPDTTRDRLNEDIAEKVELAPSDEHQSCLQQYRSANNASSATATTPTMMSMPPLPPVPQIMHTTATPAPPIRVETPLGRSQADDHPCTPGHHTPLMLKTSMDESASLGDLSKSSDDCEFDFSSHQQIPKTNRPSQLSFYEAQSTTNAQQQQHLQPEHAHLRHHSIQKPHDESLAERFDQVQSAAFGEFSAVFVVAQGKQRYAVKRTKRPMLGHLERLRRREEVEILRTLSTPTETHIVQLVDEWECNNYGYMMTEYCENGDLSRFLADQGRVSRLEEWRVWKILVELLQGLAVIHAHGILHLDLKPANVFVTFEGHLKIGDFGMATRDPVPAGFEREGDREYIAPEVLERQQYGKPADVFSTGLMMVEVAANIVLPDNGVHWHRLRSGDLSDAGRLSSGDLTTASSHHSSLETRAPPWAPKFLVDDECLLDRVVSAMLNPQPEKRPTVAQLLLMPELLLVDQRSQAGAVIYEGEFGPKPDNDDAMNVWQRA